MSLGETKISAMTSLIFFYGISIEICLFLMLVGWMKNYPEPTVFCTVEAKVKKYTAAKKRKEK